ncbi:MAG: T9SS type A sorting domain-containing protein [Bacteroidales bacterium]|jgi:hypothetical protein|nr:T9SS type A sorting domain-containing protein [Bacteroidales bacterium]
MKKLILLTTLLILCIIKLQAQNESSFTESFDQVFQNISYSGATTGILYERVIPFARLKKFNSILSSCIDTSDAHHFLQSHSELYRAAFLSSSRLPFDVDSLEALISKDASTIDVGLLLYRFNVLDSTTACRKLYFNAGILYENSTITTSLYAERMAFVAAPLKKSITIGTITYHIPDLFKFNNTGKSITRLKVDFGDGGGLRTITTPAIPVTYATTGIKTLRFEILLSSGETLTAYATINCTLPLPANINRPSYYPYIEKFEGNMAIQANIALSNPYDGGTFSKKKGNIWIYYANPDKKLRKPVLIVDGFDPENKRTFESHTEGGKTIWGMLAYNNGNNHVGLELLRLGYDLVVLDLPEGGVYIEQNAMVCIEVINRINQMLEANAIEEEIVVIGPSMGGQITRYALTYMENNPNANTNYGNHNCRLWVSFDSPHQGAHISMGAQALIDYFSGERGWTTASKVWMNTICCKAAQQMLMHHKKPGASTIHRKYYGAIRNLAPSNGGYPINLRKVAISNGSLNNTPNGVAHQIAFEGVVWWSFFIAGTVIDIRVRNAVNAGSGEVFSTTYWVLFIPIHTSVRFNNNTGKCSPDAAPGGHYNTYDQIEGALNGIGASIATNRHTHCFMPTPSVLDIRGNMNYCANISNRDLVAEGKTPFNAYWGPTSKNMEHISFDNNLIKWVFNEIETYIQGPRKSILCDLTTYTLHLPSNADPTVEITWSCSDNLNIVSGKNSTQVIVKSIKDGEGWVRVEAGNLTHSKFLKDFKIHVDPLESYPVAPSSVSQNATWATNYELPGNLTVKNGATLTVKSNIYCSPSCIVIVEPGSTLIIDGGRFTNACNGEFWQGIEIRGDRTNLSQDIAKQGYIELKNGAIIENAWTGILVGSRNLFEDFYAGGIVKANDSKFINCVTGVEFMPFRRMLNTQEFPNKSSFSNCEFIWNHSVLPQLASVFPYTHVKLRSVGKVLFKGCLFRNNTYASRVTQGIYAYNSSVNVTAITASPMNIHNVEVIQRSRFENLTYGIYYEKGALITPTGLQVSAITSNRNLYVAYSDFIGNVQGIFNTNANNSVIRHNYFKPASYKVDVTAMSEVWDEIAVKVMKEEDLSHLTQPIFNNMFGVGINLNASTGYTIQENTFSQFNYDVARGVGIHVQNSGGAPNIIDNNRFELLQVGILSNGDNKADYGRGGLQLHCNIFTDACDHAIVVSTPNGIAQFQGSQISPAGNVFAQGNSSQKWDILTNVENITNYYYSLRLLEEKPAKITPDYISLIPVDQSANCGLSSDQWQRISLETLPGVVKTHHKKYASILLSYNRLIDGGSTNKLLMELELSWNKTAWDIRKELLGKSPYLSMEVIAEVAKKGVLSHAMLLEVCLANPDATSQGDLLHILQYEIPNPMPEYMCDLIVASWDASTFRTHLEASLENAALELEQVSRQLINLYSTDTTDLKVNYNDSIIYVLERLPNIEAVYDLADIYTGFYQFDKVFNELDKLYEYKLSERETEEMYLMREWYKFIENYPEVKHKEYFLSPKEVVFLEKLAESGTKVGDRAKSLLHYYSGCTYNYHIEPIFPDFSRPRSAKSVRNLQDVLNESNNTVSVFPNPVGTYTTFMYNLQPDAQNSTLQIFDNRGRIILSTALNGNMGHYVWDTCSVSSGVYTYTILFGEKKLNNGKIVVTQ